MVKITDEILSKLTFTPVGVYTAEEQKTQECDRNILDVRQRIEGKIITEGNVLKLAHPFYGSDYILVGRINNAGGICDDCPFDGAEVEAVAHISELFEEEKDHG